MPTASIHTEKECWALTVSTHTRQGCCRQGCWLPTPSIRAFGISHTTGHALGGSVGRGRCRQRWAGGFFLCPLSLCHAEPVPAPVTAPSALPADPPTVTLSIQPQTVQEGERVVFTCMATANPEIKGYR